jgi:hypothetical protein
MKQTITRWDFLSTFTPPADLSIESGNIYRTEKLSENSPDYEFVSKAFLSTFNGRAANLAPKNPGKMIVRKKIAPPSKMIRPPPGGPFFGANPPPPIFGPGINPGIGMPRNPFGGPGHGGLPIIKKIEKVYNCVIYEKFINEFKRMLKKYPLKNINDIMKHLFHGTRATDPKVIYGSEDGLDIRFSNPGAYGTGVYFADNS